MIWSNQKPFEPSGSRLHFGKTTHHAGHGPNRPQSKCVGLLFDTNDDLLANMQEKLKRRFYHGYVLIWWGEGFPLLGWIRDRNYVVEPRTVLVLSVQLELPFPDLPVDDKE